MLHRSLPCIRCPSSCQQEASNHSSVTFVCLFVELWAHLCVQKHCVWIQKWSPGSPLCCIVPQVEAKTLQSALLMTTPTTPPVKSTRWVKWGSCHKSFGLQVLGCRWLDCWFLEKISKRILQFCKWFRECWVFMLSEKHFGAGPECRLQQTIPKNDDMGNWEPTQKHIWESFYQVHPVNLKL